MALRPVGVELAVEGQQAFKGAINSANQSLDSLKATASRITSSFDSVRNAATRLTQALAVGLAAGIAGVAVAAGGFIASGLQMNSSVEMATAQITAFTGSAEEAARLIAWAGDEASKTPFAFNDMASSIAALTPAAKTSGQSVEDLVKVAEILAATNPAEGLSGASFALKEALSGDYTSLAERFNISRVAINRFKEEGLTGLDVVTAAMEELGATGDLVTAMAETTTGRFSTLKDTFAEVVREASKPVFDLVGEGLKELQPWLDANKDAWIALLKDGISNFITGAKELATRVMPAVQSGFQFIKDGVISFRDAFSGNWTDSEVIQPFHRIAGNLGLFMRDVLEKLPIAIQWVRDNFELLKGSVIAIVAALGGVTVISAIGAAIATLLSPIGLLVGAAALLGAAWAGNWGGIQEKTAAVVAFMTPILQQLGQYFQIYLTDQVTRFGQLWNQVLVPGFQTAAAWVQGTLIPSLQNLAAWLATNIPAAAANIQGAVQTNLIDPFNRFVAFTQTYIIPLAIELKDTLDALARLGVRAVAAAYTTYLQPAIETASNWIRDNLLPIWKDLSGDFDETSDTLNTQLGPALTWLGDLLKGAVAEGLRIAEDLFNRVKTALEGVGGWINTLITKLQEFQGMINSIDFGLLQPGSPTPFEIGLRGIASAVAAVNHETSKMVMGFNKTVQAPAAGTLAGITNNYSTQRTTNVPVTVVQQGGTSSLAPWNIQMGVQSGVIAGLRYSGVF